MYAFEMRSEWLEFQACVYLTGVASVRIFDWNRKRARVFDWSYNCTCICLQLQGLKFSLLYHICTGMLNFIFRTSPCCHYCWTQWLLLTFDLNYATETRSEDLVNHLNKKPLRPLYIFKHVLKNYFVNECYLKYKWNSFQQVFDVKHFVNCCCLHNHDISGLLNIGSFCHRQTMSIALYCGQNKTVP
jgi:hypothetical protein